MIIRAVFSCSISSRFKLMAHTKTWGSKT